MNRHPRIHSNCPLEHQVAFALDSARITYDVDGEEGNRAGLDFYLGSQDLYIEVKSGHTPRTCGQMARATNVIVLQGMRSVTLFCKLLSPTLPNQP